MLLRQVSVRCPDGACQVPERYRVAATLVKLLLMCILLRIPTRLVCPIRSAGYTPLDCYPRCLDAVDALSLFGTPYVIQSSWQLAITGEGNRSMTCQHC